MTPRPGEPRWAPRPQGTARWFPQPPYEPRPLLRSILRLLAWPPMLLLGIPLNVAYNSVLYLFKRPSHGLRRFVVSGIARYLTGSLNLGAVYTPDKDASTVTPAVLKLYGARADASARTIPPIADSVPRLPILQIAGDRVRPAPVTAFMLAPKTPAGASAKHIWREAAQGEKIIYYVVGGGYQTGHPLQWSLAWDWCKDSGLRVFAPNYRKCLDEGSAFPAPLYDFLAGWQFLVDDLGFEPQNIVLNGNSAGAHAIIQLTGYLDELMESGWTSWGLPAGVFACAPWADVTASFPSLTTNYHNDWVQSVAPVIAPAYARHYASYLTNPYLSPALITGPNATFSRLAKAGVKVYVNAGCDEVLRDEIIALTDAMRASGLDPHFLLIEGGSHCEFAFAGLPITPWPGAGFSYPLVDGQWRTLLKEIGFDGGYDKASEEAAEK
ncbi:hypothetical protein Q8F55_003353 [Vanrija albida]|uniref:Alpha/beta hydrolase fold-3 domain-containing protein n=1 Tax=Vanrija albida TaxID=181172 RepID=A0ABR3Q3Z8_9TREE